MKRIALVVTLFAALAAPALADYDPELERQEAARMEAERQAEAKKQEEMRAQKQAAEIKAMRSTLGAEAEGKSDAEVRRLYDAKLAAAQKQGEEAAKSGAATAAELQRREAETRPERDAAVKEMTGKSLEELENMSDEEAEALARELEKKYRSE